MPSPIEILFSFVLISGIYGGLMLWEALRPGRVLPRISGWRIRGLVAFIAFFLLSVFLPHWWDAHLAAFQLMDLSRLGTLGGTIAGLLTYELGKYAWHRAMHGSTTLWRVFHQMHHSAERLDTFGAFYFSPMDMVGWIFLGSLSLTLIVGVTPQAATCILLLNVFLAVFQHANIKTPHWLGYLVQRPESHTVHHGRGVHAYNYADLPLFDIIFGTFRNPKGYELETGFYTGASSRVVDMVLWKDIYQPASTQTEVSKPVV